MALLNINWQAIEFERGMDLLRSSLKAAEESLEANRSETQRKLDEYEAGVANGEPPDEIWEEDVKVWDQSHAYQSDIMMIGDALHTMRKAHAIAAYHMWERAIQTWTKAPPFSQHEQLVALAESKGATMHVRLSAIRDLNNALKHNSEKYGPLLLESWRELFRPLFTKTLDERLKELKDGASKSRVDWYGAITISAQQMNEILDALRASGPR